jgi:DGQHR domain-containing protein
MKNDRKILHDEYLIVRALRCIQGGIHVYAFFIQGNQVSEISDISRINRNESGVLEGFQRKEIKEHIKQIIEYLNQGDVLFPNAIILAVSEDVVFKQARGRDPLGTSDVGQIGTLFIPQRVTGKRCAWVVDGQQRVLALSKSTNSEIAVPVIAFVAPELATQREQFVLVNKARPLPSRLINELLPEVDAHLPRDLAARKIPSELCRLLNADPHSPFHRRIKQPSQETIETAVISDRAVIDSIRRSINEPLGALASYRGLSSSNTPSDTAGMYRALTLYWSAVANVFHDAWQLPPNQSRLTHSTGIRAMGVLMDRMLDRYIRQPNVEQELRQALIKIAPHCHWTDGTWVEIGLAWNDIQNIARHVRLLTDQLIRIDTAVNLRGYT